MSISQAVSSRRRSPVRARARTVRITAHGWKLQIEGRAHRSVTQTVAHMFRLDEDLSDFYELVREDSELSWCALGAGRMLRAPTVSRTSSSRFERSYES